MVWLLLATLFQGTHALQLRAAHELTSSWRVADCRDDPDFLDAMGYPCTAWVGFACEEAHETFGYIFEEADEAALLAACPKTCGLCDATTTTTTTTAATGTTTTSTTALVTTTSTTTTPGTTTTTTTTTTTKQGQFSVDNGQGVDFNTGTRGRHMRNPEVGMRVVRGPRWVHGNDDGGFGVVGTVEKVEEAGVLGNDHPKVTVRWPSGGRNGDDDLKTYELGKQQLSESLPEHHVHFEPLSRANLVVGARVRRGPQWEKAVAHIDEDAGLPGEIVSVSGDKVVVMWTNGAQKEYPLEGEVLAIRSDAAASATGDLLSSVWKEERDNAEAIIAQEKEIIAAAMARSAATKDATVQENCQREIDQANAVIVEAQKLLDMAVEHLREVEGLADAYQAVDLEGTGTAVNATARRDITNCEEDIAKLQHLLEELRKPGGERFAVRAVSTDPSSAQWLLPLHPELDSFGSNHSRFPLNRFGHGLDRRFNRSKDSDKPSPIPDGYSIDPNSTQWAAETVPFGDGKASASLTTRAVAVQPGSLKARAAMLTACPT